MMTDFFFKLRKASVPVTLTEFLTLLEALNQRVTAHSVEEFYYLARAALVKDERYYDRFDQVFASHFKGLETLFDGLAGVSVPLEWLRKLAELTLSEEDQQLIEAMGGWEKLMETFAQRMAEQEGRHQGGNKWIGTAGTSPYGAYGYNPEGIRIGQDVSRHR
ncbi:MAG: VWA domain-containing protein, partial [Candidatus Competibacteraceae bacterium]|nr:VWA domain-containing protein [Candidatus Competibacteraceae bacterium]